MQLRPLPPPNSIGVAIVAAVCCSGLISGSAAVRDTTSDAGGSEVGSGSSTAAAFGLEPALDAALSGRPPSAAALHRAGSSEASPLGEAPWSPDAGNSSRASALAQLGQKTDLASGCAACANFVGVFDGGNGLDDAQGDKLVELTLQQFGETPKIRVLCYEGAGWGGYCKGALKSSLRHLKRRGVAEVELLPYDLKQDGSPSKFKQYLEGPEMLRAHILVFSPGDTLKDMMNLQRGGLDTFLRNHWSTSSTKLPVVWGSSAGMIVWFDGGVSDSCGEHYCPMARIAGLGVLPGFVCPHADSPAKCEPKDRKRPRRRSDIHASARRVEAEWYQAPESGLQLDNWGSVWIANGAVHHLTGRAKSFAGRDMLGEDLGDSAHGKPLSSYVYGTGASAGSTGRLTLEDVPRDFRISSITQTCFTDRKRGVTQKAERGSTWQSDAASYIRRLYSASEGAAPAESQCLDFEGSGDADPRGGARAKMWSCDGQAARWKFRFQGGERPGEPAAFGLIQWQNPNLDVGPDAIGSPDSDSRGWCLDVRSGEWSKGSVRDGGGASVILWPCGDDVARWKFDKKAGKIVFLPDKVPLNRFAAKGDLQQEYCLDFVGSYAHRGKPIRQGFDDRAHLWPCKASNLFVDGLLFGASSSSSALPPPSPPPPLHGC